MSFHSYFTAKEKPTFKVKAIGSNVTLNMNINLFIQFKLLPAKEIQYNTAATRSKG